MSASLTSAAPLIQAIKQLSTRRFDITSCGAALVDTEITVSDEQIQQAGIEKGVMTLVDAEQRQTLLQQFAESLKHAALTGGGSAANSLVTAAYLGRRNFLSCRVGKDSNGDQFLTDFHEAGVTLNDNAQRDDAPTGQCLVMITPDAERTMCTNLGASALLSKDEVVATAIESSKVLYIEGYQVAEDAGFDASMYALDVAKQAGTITALSLSDPAMAQFFNERIRSFLDVGIDIVFCNQDEALATAKTETLEEAISFLTKRCKLLLVTQGAKGVTLASTDERMAVAGFKAEAIDTNGAGDTFAGAFLAKLLEHSSLADSARFANYAASCVVAQYKPRLDRQTLEALTQSKALAS